VGSVLSGDPCEEGVRHGESGVARIRSLPRRKTSLSRGRRRSSRTGGRTRRPRRGR
jgi:hypothetical protein